MLTVQSWPSVLLLVTILSFGAGAVSSFGFSPRRSKAANWGRRMKKPPLVSAQRRLFTVHNDKGVGVYFSEALIEVNLVFRLVPRPLTTAMIARAMPEAISPYSMAVAPVWSCMKRAKSLVIGTLLVMRRLEPWQPRNCDRVK